MSFAIVLSDNVLALIGSLAALILCSGVISLSYHFGPAANVRRVDRSPPLPNVVKRKSDDRRLLKDATLPGPHQEMIV